MVQRRAARSKAAKEEGLGRGLSPQAKAVMRAFKLAKFSAPGFVLSCGVFPEVSESASDRLHSIVHDVAVRQLQKDRHLRALQKRVKQLAAKANGHTPGAADLVDRADTHLTALLAAEATAAYLFGLAVGLAVRSLPDRLER
jgi:hypothetical protein